ncbi:MAG TPA: ABC transporter [Lachnospiraceae bacterium]|jgi:ABC-2 type transport system permease protein|nr:ABC transporter [Lachnospiraceae bacterium]HCM11926.1 ABC transporter [Lachnospiraceae bacterium]
MLAIYKKELRSYFTSMIGYVFIAFFLVIIGIYFMIYNLMFGLANFEYCLSTVTFIFVLLVPLLTMRLMSEEKKQKTDQLLLTSPLSARSIILGKFFAVFTIFAIVMAIICMYPLIMSLYGSIPYASAYGSILGFTLLGGAYLAMGLFISSLTESQMVAAVISFAVFLFTALMEGFANIFPTDNKTAYMVFSVIVLLICLLLYHLMHNYTVSLTIGVVGIGGLTAIYLLKPTMFDGSVIKVFEWLSVISRFDTFSAGIFDLSGVIYYLSIIFLFTFLSMQVIKKRRWS